MDAKYKMFRNFMINELGISKEDIEEWTKETVKEVAQNFIYNRYSEVVIKEIIEQAIMKSYRSGQLSRDLHDKIASQVVKMFNFTITKKIVP